MGGSHSQALGQLHLSQSPVNPQRNEQSANTCCMSNIRKIPPFIPFIFLNFPFHLSNLGSGRRQDKLNLRIRKSFFPEEFVLVT
jgi:hypothetical protein